ncbi:MAG: cytochrome P450 [Bacteroidetes bacterium]|nr:cytochrome P450 [Bacteroidota bacterium]MBK9541932.1 cytochrome P450 [Bacteroidota bacterium]MBP6403774.1 cytochrome P450 [Bacteroidia bacterium]MBP6648824.1 cytochrome P450 [Bacteroidia bacterium]
MNTAILKDDLMAPEVVADPHSYYRTLRENERVHWNERWKGWVLTGYKEVVDVLRDPENFSSDRMGYLEKELSQEEQESIAPIFHVLKYWMVFRDPPEHTVLRMLLNKLFTPVAIERYRPMVRKIVQKALDKVVHTGKMEVIRDFAYDIPMSVILELIGAPDLDRDKIKEWSEAIGVFFFIKADEPRRREIACEGINSLVEYITPLIQQRRDHPGIDLISLLISAEEAGQITYNDVLATCVLLIFGGHETTMNLIANGTLALMEHPEQWEILRDNPVFLKRAVEELLRYDGSVKSTVRWAKKDVMVGDKLVKQGERLLVSLSGANRDPLQFENPDTLDVTRDPNLHVAFAHGIHVCLGASLARMEAEEAFAGLIKRITCPKVDEDAYLNYYPSVVHRALKNLPVTFHAIK